MDGIKVTDLFKHYKVGPHVIKAVDGISFEVKSGEFTIILGPSGAGKTTLLNLLGGMEEGDSGSINIGGRDILGLSERALTLYRRQDVGFVFQFYNLMPNLTAAENVELASEICRSPLDALQMLEKVGLSDRTTNFPAQLSGGEQQRVSIARALAKNPRLLLCDEPTGALDYKTGKTVLRILHDACKKDGKTVLVITHNAVIADMADKVISMKSGKIADITLNSRPADISALEW